MPKWMDPLLFAKVFAATKHGDQQYATGLPYTHHLAAVEEVLCRFKEDIYDTVKGEIYRPGDGWFEFTRFFFLDLQEAAWLHDVVEDTGTKLEEIEEIFGAQVATLVGAVTNEKGENRKVRAALTYPKIRNTPGATALKLADRIANVEAGGKLVEMYKREYKDFRRSLFVAGVNDEMWAHLDRLMAYVPQEQ